MAPIVHCVRHAQGYHNLSQANHILLDPLLTPHGEKQCKELNAAFPRHSNIDLVVASPLRRTLYTALLSFEGEIKSKDLKIIGLPDIQETSDVACDTGSDLNVLQKEVTDNSLPVDLSLVGEDWNSNKGKFAPSAEAISDRAREARRWLKARPEKEIVLVSHGGFLHYFTEDWEDSTLYQGTGWRNTEYRTFAFTDTVDEEDFYGHRTDSDNASIVETAESRTRRGKPAEGPSRAQQKQFFLQALKGWENQMVEFARLEAEKKGHDVDIEQRAGEKVVKGEGEAEEARVCA